MMMAFRDEAKDAIRASGGRITTQRELLLDLLAEHTGGIDAEGLHQLAVQHDPTISLPTVYRTLHTLEDAHVIASHYVSTDHDRKLYRVKTEAESFHFTCRNCGQVMVFQSALIGQLRQELGTQLGADVMTLCMCAGGLCADCRQEERTMTLDQLQSGQKATIRKIAEKGAIRRRLMDMGLVRGVTIEMVKAAPLGDPLEYLVRGYHLSLRKSEAEMVEIELC
jgi:Fe2+ or Zn2+ uptake regulation protein/Fe2+ transport system protein FeoA